MVSSYIRNKDMNHIYLELLLVLTIILFKINIFNMGIIVNNK